MRSFRLLLACALVSPVLAVGGPAAAAARPAPVTAAANPAVAHVGSVVTVTGTLSRHPGTVTLQRLVGKAWRAVGHGKSNRTGEFSLAFRAPKSAATVLLRVAGPVAPQVSRTLRVRVVKAIFTVRATTPALVSDLGHVVVTGTASPKAHGSVRLQRLSHGSWVTVVTAASTSAGHFTLRTTLPQGSYGLRVLRPATTTIAAGVSKTMPVRIATPPVVTTAALPTGTAGFPYSAQLAAGGGLPPYTWTVPAGALPRGLSLSAAGVITGRPAAHGSTVVTTTVTDAIGDTATAALTVVLGSAAPLDWGLNENGQLGDGGTTNAFQPAAVTGLTDVASMAGSTADGYAVQADGTVWAWGANDHGQLGDGSIDAVHDALSPVQVSLLSDVTAVAAGEYGAYALRSDGTVWAWGSSSFGQLGNGSTDDSDLPVQVSGLAHVTSIAAAGVDGYALRSDGTVWSWGLNSQSQLGDGTTNDAHTPVEVSGLTGATAIAAGSYTAYALRADGTVWDWGYGGDGELGNAGTAGSGVPVEVSGLTGATAVSAGGSTGYALRADGGVWAWGANNNGQLGNGSLDNSVVPVQVRLSSPMAAVTGAASDGYAIGTDGKAYSWGYDLTGQLGTLTLKTTLHLPFLIAALGGVLGIGAGSSSLSAYAVERQ